MTDVPASVDIPRIPPCLRGRVLVLASQGLSQMPSTQIPPSLRRSVSFAPARRVKLVGAQIARSVEIDDEFRKHLAIQVRATAGDLAVSLGAGESPRDEVLPEAAAVAFILRPPGWEDIVTRAVAAQTAPLAGHNLDATATIEKLQSDLGRARGEVKRVRDKLKTHIEQVKADNTALRRTLGQARAELKDAQEHADRAEASAAATGKAAEVAARSAESEHRRLRQRIDQLESDNAASRRAVRDDRESEVMRLRLLLDTITESASGLRRELALPPSELLPADTVPSIDPGVASQSTGIGRALLSDDPALLRKLLEVPRSHLIVDGYNVSKAAWPTVPLAQQRSRLAGGVAALVAGKSAETTIVFDGADLGHPPAVTAPRGIRVRFSPPGVIADDLIRQLVSAEPVGRSVIVVSTDREVAESVAKMGARSVASVALIKAMGL